MKRMTTTLLAAAMAVTSLATLAGPGSAAPIAPQGPAVQQSTDLFQVRDRRHHDRFERRGNYYYYNGHRGDRHRHPGWREYNGWWFPPAAFLGGAIIGGIIANQTPQYSSDRHIRWCINHHRNYRASDNTYRAPNGRRYLCDSPYSR